MPSRSRVELCAATRRDSQARLSARAIERRYNVPQKSMSGASGGGTPQGRGRMRSERTTTTKQRTLTLRALPIAEAALTMAALAPTAQAAPVETARTQTVPVAVAGTVGFYSAGYYVRQSDCEDRGCEGVGRGEWTGYVCTNGSWLPREDCRPRPVKTMLPARRGRADLRKKECTPIGYIEGYSNHPISGLNIHISIYHCVVEEDRKTWRPFRATWPNSTDSRGGRWPDRRPTVQCWRARSPVPVYLWRCANQRVATIVVPSDSNTSTQKAIDRSTARRE